VGLAGARRLPWPPQAAFRPTKEAARDAEAELLQELKARAAAQDQVDQAPATLRQLFAYYVEDLEARGKGADTVARAKETQQVLKRVLPELLDRPVSRIGDGELYAFRQARLRDGKVIRERVDGELRERLAPAKPSTINRDLRTLRAMLKRAIPGYRFPAGVFLPEDETRVRWLRPEEELLVLDTLRSPFREIAKLAALTLMRLSEIRLLRREHVHLEQGVIMLPRAKAGARPVILSGEAQKILRGQLAAHEREWVFPGPDGAPYDRSYVGRVFRRAARAAGLRDFHFHDLRHHGATMALNRGFTAPIVMALGGWKTERMMRRYAAVTDQTLRAAAEAVSGAEFAAARSHRPDDQLVVPVGSLQVMPR
jgi:integrase